jgi:hypothetical protein
MGLGGGPPSRWNLISGWWNEPVVGVAGGSAGGAIVGDVDCPVVSGPQVVKQRQGIGGGFIYDNK